MTRQDYWKKWLAYGIALVLTAGLQELVFARARPLGVVPVLLPLAMTALAALEGPVSGAGFGIAVGLMDVYLEGAGAWVVVLLCLGGLATGLLGQHLLSKNFVGYVVCSVGVLAVRMAGMVIPRWLENPSILPLLLRLGGLEGLWTMILCPIVYVLFRFMFHRWGSAYYDMNL